MANKKVRVGSLYAYDPVPFDQFSPPSKFIHSGDVVKVVNLRGCPRANTMGMCYIAFPDGEFIGMVCTNSLKKVKKVGKKYFLVEE